MPTAPSAGFYRGTITTEPGGSIFGVGTQDFLADVTENGDFTGNSHGFGMEVSAVGQDMTLVCNGTVLNGKVKTSKQGRGFSFTFLNGDTPIVSGSVAPATLPSLGTKRITPTPGIYRGEIFVVADGHFRSYGQVEELRVGADAHLTARTSIASGWMSSPIFDANVQAGGTLSDAAMISNGIIVGQLTTPTYSFDGTTLVLHFSNLLLEPGEAYLVVKQES